MFTLRGFFDSCNNTRAPIMEIAPLLCYFAYIPAKDCLGIQYWNLTNFFPVNLGCLWLRNEFYGYVRLVNGEDTHVFFPELPFICSRMCFTGAAWMHTVYRLLSCFTYRHTFKCIGIFYFKCVYYIEAYSTEQPFLNCY